MNPPDAGRRVALLARPGPARDCVRGALLEIGAEIVAEDDPASADPEAMRAVAPQVLMVVLDAGSEDALGRFDIVIGDPSIEVMFEEADVAVAREGWEAARWRRHLAAKLNHRSDVLPPVAGAAGIPAIDALSVQLGELISTDEPEFPPLAQVDLPVTATGGDDFSIFDPLLAETGTDEDGMLTVHGFEHDLPSLDLTPVTGPDFSASDFDPLLAELDAQMPDTSPAPAEWQGGLVEDFGALEPGSAESPAEAGSSGTMATELSLADETMPNAPSRAARGVHDIDELERRISSLELVDDMASPSGAVLVMAGVGGPDAVRQFIGALPVTFPRAVLVRQSLDGARYDKLVAQMQRATSLPVALARAGEAAMPGTVYILADDIGMQTTGGLRFNGAGAASLLDSLAAIDSAVVVLSGADAADAERIMRLRDAGAVVGAQVAEGCYDAAAANALSASGVTTGAPSELAQQIAKRWRS